MHSSSDLVCMMIFVLLSNFSFIILKTLLYNICLGPFWRCIAKLLPLPPPLKFGVLTLLCMGGRNLPDKISDAHSTKKLIHNMHVFWLTFKVGKCPPLTEGVVKSPPLQKEKRPRGPKRVKACDQSSSDNLKKHENYIFSERGTPRNIKNIKFICN